MHTARLLAEATELARSLGYRVREDLLEGAGGGHCLVGRDKWILLDVSQTVEEQLSDVIDALRAETGLWNFRMSAPLAQQLQLTKAA
jgi:hypothetical protein